MQSAACSVQSAECRVQSAECRVHYALYSTKYKVHVFLEGPAIGGNVNEGIYAQTGGETISHSMSGWLKTGSASAIILLLTSAKNCSQPTKIARRKNCSCNLFTMSKFIVSKNLLNKYAHGESILLMENQFCSRRILNCPSFYLQSKYGRMTRFIFTHKLHKAKKICSQ